MVQCEKRSLRLATALLAIMAASALQAQTGARYLIIANDSFFGAVQPLAQWKTRKGMQCRVVKTSEAGRTRDNIRGYIVNAYNTWNPRPEFVLLVGSGSLLQAFQKGWGQSAIFTDNPYGNMTGDYRSELPCGRFPCRTTRECSTMVAKVLAYERTPYPDDSTWYQRATAVTGDSGDSDAPTYWADIRFVAGLMADAGYRSVDSLASSRHNDASDVTRSVNSGTSFVLYRGTATNYWYPPFDMRPEFQYLNNGTRLPIVCSFTCQTIVLDQYQDMTGNTWIKTGTPTGLGAAVACIGNTHSASHVASKRSSMTRGFFTGIFSESLPTLGSAVLHGKLQIYNDFRDSMEYMGFNLLGDPEMNIFTSMPRAVQVTFDTAVPIGARTYSVAVEKDGIPLPHALICISDGGSIYQYGYSDAGGRKDFSINPTQEGFMDVTVTGRNCIPSEGRTRIYDPNGVTEDESPKSGASIPRLLSITPNPGADRFTIATQSGSRVQVFGMDGRRVWTAAAADGVLRWDAQNLPAGIYLVRSWLAGGEPVTGTLQKVR